MATVSNASFDAPLTWALPSFVIPGDIATNAKFLAGKAPGVALCFFETKSCLAYTAGDLPLWLGGLPLAWHLHLPLDLPWEQGGEAVAEICGRLWAKVAFLNPGLCVLHPPASANALALLTSFVENWRCHCPIALENTAHCQLLEENLPLLAALGFSFCLDAGHALGYAQTELMTTDFAEQALVWHWSAPGPGGVDAHLPLRRLTQGQLDIARALLRRSRKDAIHVLEIFHWQDIGDSLRILSNLAQRPLEQP